MKMPSKRLRILKTSTAEKKIIEIAKWSAKKWGRKTARDYLSNIERIINGVASGLLPTQKTKSLVNGLLITLPNSITSFLKSKKTR